MAARPLGSEVDVMRSWLLPALLVLCGPALADQDADDYQAPRYRIGRIAKIEVIKPALRDDFDPKEDCDTFVMTPKLAKFFITHARVASTHWFRSESDLSSCLSQGTVTFSSGEVARWTIYRNGRGILGIASGKREGMVVPLRCRRCEDWNL